MSLVHYPHEFDLVVRELFDQWPDTLINCAAVSSPDLDQDPAYAHLINVETARKLAEVSSI